MIRTSEIDARLAMYDMAPGRAKEEESGVQKSSCCGGI